MSYVSIVVEDVKNSARRIDILKGWLKEEQRSKQREIIVITIEENEPKIQDNQSVACKTISDCKKELKDLLPESIGSEVLPYLAEIHESLQNSDFEGASETLRSLDSAVKVDLKNYPAYLPD